MRRTVRLLSAVGPTERLGQAVAALPSGVQRTLADVAARNDLPLVAGSWHGDDSGCLVANAVACAAAGGDVDETERTLDLRMLDAFPELSSRDLNLLIVAWDEAAAQDGADGDADLRCLLRAALRWAGVADGAVGGGPVGAGASRGGVPVGTGGRP